MSRYSAAPAAMVALMAGCVSYEPGSLRAIAAEQHRALMTECMSKHTDDILELSVIDPSYIFRLCRHYADSRVAGR